MRIHKTLAGTFLARSSSPSRPVHAKTYRTLVLTFVACAAVCSPALARPEVPQTASNANTGAINRESGFCFTTNQETAEGNDLLQAGRFAEARTKLHVAFEKAKASGAGSVDIACLMNLIGLSEQRAHHPQDAVEWMERALGLESLPEGLVAILTSNLATAYFDLNRLDRSEELARRALVLAERAFGPGHPGTLSSQVTLSLVFAQRGEHARAEPVLRRILHLSQRIWGESSFEAAHAAINLADIYYDQGRYSMAAELLKKSIATLEAAPVRDRSDLPLAQAALAVCSAAGRRDADAKVWLERASASMQDLAPNDPARAPILERSAVANFALKEVDAGKRLFEDSIAFLESYYGPGSPESFRALERYAAALRIAKDKAGLKRVEARKAFVTRR